MTLVNIIKSNKHIIFWLLFVFGLALLIFLQYFGLIFYHYPVPPGHDAAMHWIMSQPFFRGEVDLWSYLKNGDYPPGFPILISAMAHLFKTDTLQTMLWFAPAIIIVAALTIFLLTKKLFGRKAALLSFLLYSFATTINIQQLNDGGYPNLITAQILLPLLLFLILSLFDRIKTIYKIIIALLVLIIFLLVPFTHHLTTLYLIAILIILIPSIIIYFWIVKKWSAVKGIYILLVLTALAIISACCIARLPIFSSALGLIKSAVQFYDSFPFIKIIGHLDPEAVIPHKSLPGYISYPIFFFGVLGIFALPITYRKKNKQIFLAIVTISIWALVLLAGSRLGFLSNPDRLARDSVYPLSILAGGFLIILLNFLSQKNRVLFILAIAATLVLVSIPLKRRVTNALKYEPMVRITDADISAINNLKTQPGERILIESYAFYFERFLPQKEITYLWSPQTEQLKDSHLLDPNNPADLARLESFDYIYTVERQQGWVPKAVQIGTNELRGNSHFQQIGHYVSTTNEIYLFEVIH
jgi:hypothetical protein